MFELSEEHEVCCVDGKYVRVSELPAPKRRGMLRSDIWAYKHGMPSGKQCIRASSPYPRAAWEKQWRETDSGELASKSPQIVRELESEAGPIAKLVEERRAEIERQEWERQQRRWQREEAERKRKEDIKRSREQLLAIVEAWSLARRRIDAFFEDAEQRRAKLGADEQEALRDRIRPLIAWYERQGYVRTGDIEPFPYDDATVGTPLRNDLALVILSKALN